MKKKLVLIFISTFLLIFLLWPASGYGFLSASGSCNDSGELLPQGEEIDCAPPRLPKPGGGLRYLIFLLEGKENDPSSDYNHYVFLENGDNFQPQKALIVATFVSGVATFGAFNFSKQKNKKPVNKR
jgi:hypothetical protein